MKHSSFLTITVVVLAVLFRGVASGANKYWGGGNSDITDGTPLPQTVPALCGNWDSTVKNWATSPDGATYDTWNNGDVAWFDMYQRQAAQCYVTNLNDATVSGIVTFGPHQANNHVNITSPSATPRVLTISGDQVLFNIVSADQNAGLTIRRYTSLAGSGNIYKTGNGPVVLQANNNAFTGKITIDRSTLSSGNDFQPGANWSLNGVTEINVIQRVLNPGSTTYGSDISYGTFSMTGSATDDKLSDSLVITLKRGFFNYSPAATSSETMGQIVFAPQGYINVSGGSAGGVLTLAHATAGISRGSDGLGTGSVTVPGGGSPNANIRVQNGVATDTLLPWLITSRAEFMQVDSANNNTLTRIAATDAATDLTTWDTTYDNTYNVRVGNGTAVTLTGVIDNNTTLKTLAFNNTTATTVTNAPGVTLTIDSGAIAFAPNGYGQHQTISGGSLASGQSYLYLIGNDSSAASSLNIYSPIVGTLDLIKAGYFTLNFYGSSANTYSGTTYVNAGNLNLQKAAGTVAIPGDLVIKYGGAVQLSANDQIATSANITIEEGGQLAHGLGSLTTPLTGTLTINGGTYICQNNTTTLGKSGTGLAFNGGWIVHNSGGAGTFNLQTDVSYASSATKQARWECINTSVLNIELDGGNRTFNIADSSTLPADVPEMVIDMPIVPGSPAGGAITKTGSGVLMLVGRNTYGGGTTINGGTLRVGRLHAPARSGLVALLDGTREVTFKEPVATNFVVRQPISGFNIPSSRWIARVLNEHQVLLNNTTLNGTQTVASVSAIDRYGSLGVGAVIVNAGGTLQIDAGVSVTNWTQVNANGTAIIEGELASGLVNAGTVKGNGTILALTNAAGGVVAPGASVGVLTVSGNALFQNDSEWEIEWNDGVTNDVIVVNGNFVASGSPIIKVVNIGGTPNFETQVVLKVTGTYTGPAGGYTFDLPTGWSAITSGGDLINLGGGNYAIAFIPEPGVIGLAVLALVAMRRK